MGADLDLFQLMFSTYNFLRKKMGSATEIESLNALKVLMQLFSLFYKMKRRWFFFWSKKKVV